MSIAYRSDTRNGLTLVVWSGTVSADVFLKHVERILADGEWPRRDGCT